MNGTPMERVVERGVMAPKPEDRGQLDIVLRYVCIRDGIKNCIEVLPLTDKGVARKLQEAWLMVDYTVRSRQAERPPAWQLPLPE